MRARLLGPLGMSRTAFLFGNELPPNAARGYVPTGRGGFLREPATVPPPGSDGGVHSTVHDLLRFDRELHMDAAAIAPGLAETAATVASALPRNARRVREVASVCMGKGAEGCLRLHSRAFSRF